MKIEVSNIKKSYGRNEILKDISFSAESGKCIGVLGKNGCGKSTLLSVLAGVQKPDGGSFTMDGHSLFGSPSLLRKNVGYVPQGTPLIDELTAYDNLLLWYSRDDLKRELDGGVLSMLGVGDFLKKRVDSLSGGMKKRLSIGCAMFEHPPVLLLDEPCAALDIECKENILSYLRDYKARGGVLLLTTHDEMELSLCDECRIMRRGVLYQYDYDGDISRLVKNL